jgi:hypothetical protein
MCVTQCVCLFVCLCALNTSMISAGAAAALLLLPAAAATFLPPQGYEAVLKEVYSLPDTHDMPSAPALDAGQWVDTHFKEVRSNSPPPNLPCFT